MISLLPENSVWFQPIQIAFARQRIQSALRTIFTSSRQLTETQQVIAEGVIGGHQNWGSAVLKMISGFDLLCLKKTKDGYPIHPLYVRTETEPTKYIG